MSDPTPYCQLNGVASGIVIVGMFAFIAFVFWASLQYLRWLHKFWNPQAMNTQPDTVLTVCNEIKEIMQTYREQAAQGYVDTPGGLEHMGDVWSLLRRWDELLSTPQKPGPSGEREAMSRAELDVLSEAADQAMVRLRSKFPNVGKLAELRNEPSPSVEGRLELYAEDPMWADHAEVPKKFLRQVLEALTKLSQEKAVSDFRVREQDEFIQLRAVKELELEAERDRLSLEVGRLAEALKPFAAVADWFDQSGEAGYTLSRTLDFTMSKGLFSTHFSFTAGNFYEARNALAGGA